MKSFLYKGVTHALCMVLLLACKRDMVKKDSSNAMSDCRIKQLIMKSEGAKDRSGVFTYNTKGDPIAYTPAGYSNGSLKYEFRYDNNGRLMDYIGYYPTSMPLNCEFWIRYEYDHNKIVRDSIYYNCRYGPSVSGEVRFTGVTFYEYDKQERISSVMYRQFFDGLANGVVGYYRFDYNSAGNLVTPGAKYDDKVSIYRTNKIWMFLSRNYSINNIKTASAYNSNGLPVSFPAAAARGASIHFFESLDISNCEILYECKN